MDDYMKVDERLKHILSPAEKAFGRRCMGTLIRYFHSGLLCVVVYSPVAVGGWLYELSVDYPKTA
jgi:hypothetical protein